MSEIPKLPIALSPEGFSKYLDGDNEELVESKTIEQGTGWRLVREEWHVIRFRIVADPGTEVAHTTLDRRSPNKRLRSGRR